jgi:hypothetical protein
MACEAAQGTCMDIGSGEEHVRVMSRELRRADSSSLSLSSQFSFMTIA